MKKCLGYILAFYVLFNSMLPCYIWDECEEEQATEQSPHSSRDRDCSNCSPFSICSANHSFLINTVSTGLVMPELYAVREYNYFYIGTQLGYCSGHFQPPRI